MRTPFNHALLSRHAFAELVANLAVVMRCLNGGTRAAHLLPSDVLDGCFRQGTYSSAAGKSMRQIAPTHGAFSPVRWPHVIKSTPDRIFIS
jgi:hypothetical protein